MAKSKREYVNNKALHEEIMHCKGILQTLEDQADRVAERQQAEAWKRQGRFRTVDEGLIVFRDQRRTQALTKECVTMFTKICRESNRRFTYRESDDRDDCLSQAMLQLLRNWPNYDPEKSSNAFAYVTQILTRGFAHAWNKLHPLKSAQRISLSNHRDAGGLHNL